MHLPGLSVEACKYVSTYIHVCRSIFLGESIVDFCSHCGAFNSAPVDAVLGLEYALDPVGGGKGVSNPCSEL